MNFKKLAAGLFVLATCCFIVLWVAARYGAANEWQLIALTLLSAGLAAQA